MSAINGEPTESDSIDLYRLFRHLIQYRREILICTLVSTAAFVIYAFVATPIYQVSTVLSPAATYQMRGYSSLGFSSLGGIASDLTGGGPHNSKVASALAVLHSRQFVEEFIKENGLLPKLFPRRSLIARRSSQLSEKGLPTLADGYEYFDKKVLKIREEKGTDLITVGLRWSNASEAATWLNQLIATLNAKLRGQAIRSADRSLKYLTAQLKSTTTVEVRKALAGLIAGEEKKRMIAQVSPQYAFRIIAPPIANDGANPVWPNKLMLLILGAIIGFSAGLLGTLAWRYRTPISKIAI